MIFSPTAHVVLVRKKNQVVSKLIFLAVEIGSMDNFT